MAVTTRDTVDIIRDIVAGMTPNVIISAAVDNGDGTYTLDISNTYWLRAKKKINIDGKQYFIVSFVINESITIEDIDTGAGIPTVLAFALPAPNFFHGATMPASDEQSKIKSAALKTPFVWLYERLPEKDILDPLTRWGLESSPRIFFMDEADSKNQYAPGQKTNVTDPMRQMVRFLTGSINDEPGLYKEIEDNTSTAIANWGAFTEDKGNADRYFDQDLSGRVLTLDFAATKQACSKQELIVSVCGLSVTVGVCPTTTTGGSEGTAEAFPCGASGSVTYKWDDPLEQTTKKAVNLPEGTFTVIVRDEIEGCNASNSGIILGPGPAPDCNISADSMDITPPALDGGSDGTATVTTSGSLGAPTFEWSNGQTTATATGLSSGPISVAVGDSAIGGCISQLLDIVPVGTDVNAQLYIDTFTSPSEDLKAAIDTFFKNLKGGVNSNLVHDVDVYSDLLYGNPFPPLATPTRDSMKLNMFNPSDTDAAFRTDWFNNPVASQAGITGNGSNMYGDIHFDLAANLSEDNYSVTYGGTIGNFEWACGVDDGSNTVGIRRVNNDYRMWSGSGFGIVPVTDPGGIHISTMNRIAECNCEHYIDGVFVNMNSGVGNELPIGYNMSILGVNFSGNTIGENSGTANGLFIGNKLSQNQVENLHEAIDIFNTAVR